MSRWVMITALIITRNRFPNCPPLSADYSVVFRVARLNGRLSPNQRAWENCEPPDRQYNGPPSAAISVKPTFEPWGRSKNMLSRMDQLRFPMGA
jgi:hypothetical protein